MKLRLSLSIVIWILLFLALPVTYEAHPPCSNPPCYVPQVIREPEPEPLLFYIIYQFQGVSVEANSSTIVGELVRNTVIASIGAGLSWVMATRVSRFYRTLGKMAPPLITPSNSSQSSQTVPDIQEAVTKRPDKSFPPPRWAITLLGFLIICTPPLLALGNVFAAIDLLFQGSGAILHVTGLLAAIGSIVAAALWQIRPRLAITIVTVALCTALTTAVSIAASSAGPFFSLIVIGVETILLLGTVYLGFGFGVSMFLDSPTSPQPSTLVSRRLTTLAIILTILVAVGILALFWARPFL